MALNTNIYLIYVYNICIIYMYIYNFSVWLQKENSYKNIFVLTFTYVTAILHYLLVFCSLSGISSFNPRRLSISKLFLKFLLHLFIYLFRGSMHGGRRTTCGSQFFPLYLRIKLGSYSLVASILTFSVILATPELFFVD